MVSTNNNLHILWRL